MLAERAHAPRPKASYAARTASGLLKLLHWVRHQPIKTDDDEWLDAMMPLWAQQARERGTRPRWARERARRCLPRLVEERDVSWWLARESRERPRRGGGWTPDNLADHLGIREWWLEACFGPNCRMRCGLVSLDRPKDVREAERQAQRNGKLAAQPERNARMSEAEAERRAQERREKDAARKRAERKAKGAKAHAESASRLKPWETFGWSRRTWDRRGKPAYGQADANSSVQNSSAATHAKHGVNNAAPPEHASPPGSHQGEHWPD